MATTASASLFFGLHVRVADTVAAGKAFDAIKPTLLGLDLIDHRRAAGSLARANRPAAAITRVPVEVWDSIRKEVIRLAVADGRRTVLELVHCKACAASATGEVFHQEAPAALKGQRSAKKRAPFSAFDSSDSDTDMNEVDTAFHKGISVAMDRRRHAHQEQHVGQADWAEHPQEFERGCRHGQRRDLSSLWARELAPGVSLSALSKQGDERHTAD